MVSVPAGDFLFPSARALLKYVLLFPKTGVTGEQQRLTITLRNFLFAVRTIYGVCVNANIAKMLQLQSSLLPSPVDPKTLCGK